MKIYTLIKKQIIKSDINTCWDFFSNPANLEHITPPDLGLEVITTLPEKMYQGMIIEYKVNPFPGIKQTWITEITHVDKPNYFVDEQRFGPYKFWHHQHHFNKLDDNRTEISDIVNYALPFDPFSRIINTLLVSKRLEDIFSYREKVLTNKFGNI